MPDAPPSLDDQALAWHARLNDPSATAADRERFRRWRGQSPAHAAAHDRARALWEDLETPARRLGHGGWYGGLHRRRRRVGRAAAALAATAALVLSLTLWRDPGLEQRWLADLATAPGQTLTTELSDGSTLVLDRDSAVDVALTAEGRRLTLRRGRLWIDVAHTGTPFAVKAGDADIRVLGTAFAVERREGLTRVAVERGRVAVAVPERDFVLSAGRMLTLAAAGQPPSPATFEPATTLAWRRGLVVFDRATLGEVAAQIERLRPGRVIVIGKTLRGRTLSGVFSADRPESILAALGDGLGLSVTRIPGLATLIHP